MRNTHQIDRQNSPEKGEENVEKHPKQDFQVERLAFFSDAVFAIALTLLVIEFKIPRITGETTYNDVLKQLFDLKYLFVATLLSFFLISSYWRSHHILFKYIHNYDNKLVIINMLMLLPIIFVPFTTAFFAESFNGLFVNDHINLNVYFLGFRLFIINHFCAALMSYICYWYAFEKHKELSLSMPAKEKLTFRLNHLFSIFFFFIIFIALTIGSILVLDTAIWVVIIPWIIIRRKLTKKLIDGEKSID
ncbi:MAG: TMEM175 family protein [Paludibacter sp.]|nr:TMEM175 family protein [Paludibacter sp.]